VTSYLDTITYRCIDWLMHTMIFIDITIYWCLILSRYLAFWPINHKYVHMFIDLVMYFLCIIYYVNPFVCPEEGKGRPQKNM
jgi:hypothetical protein